MNSVGLSSICQGTNGLNGSALRAIFSTFGPLLALGCVVADCVPLGAHAPTSSTAIATPMTGHREFSEFIKSLLPDENDQRSCRVRDDLPPRRAPARQRIAGQVRIILRPPERASESAPRNLRQAHPVCSSTS